MFKRMSNLVRGFLSLFISGIERENPEALLEVEKENLRKQISEYNTGLAGHAGLCERLVSQIKRQEQEERDLSAKTMAHLKSANQEVAAQYALRLQNLRRDLEENRAQAKSAEETYQELLRAREFAVKAAHQKIEALKYAIDDMRIKKATAELTEMASGMISQLGGSGDTLNRLQEIVQTEQQKAAGRARVARDSMNMPDLAMKEAEQKALANQALAEFAAQAGIALQPMSAGAASSSAAPTQTSPQTSTPAQSQPAGKEALGPTQIKT
jgi:phage shock protein A